MEINSEVIRNSIGSKIKNARTSQQLTQEITAEHVGISVDLLRNIENCRNLGSLSTLLKLCNFLKITPNELFCDFIENPKKSPDIYLKSTLSSLSADDQKIMCNVIKHLYENYIYNKDE